MIFGFLSTDEKVCEFCEIQVLISGGVFGQKETLRIGFNSYRDIEELDYKLSHQDFFFTSLK
jgi:hypothetical protein